MKYCTHCSREYPDEALFCMNCGQALTDAAGPAPEETPGMERVTEAPALPDAEAVPVAIALAEPPGTKDSEPSDAAETDAPPPSPTEPPPRKRGKGGAARLGFLRHAGALLLSLALFFSLFIPVMVYELRDSAGEVWIREYLHSLPLADSIDTISIELVIEDWLTEMDPAYEDVEVYISRRDVNTLLEQTTLLDSAAAQIARHLRGIFSGTASELFGADDIYDFLTENSAVINTFANEMFGDLGVGTSGFRLSRSDRLTLASYLSELLERSELRALLRTDTMRAEAPALWFALHYGCSWVTFAVCLVLAVLLYILLSKTLKSWRRGLNRAGIVLIVLGGILTAAALTAQWFYGIWLALFGGAEVLALLVRRFLVTHLAINSAILCAGIVLTVVTGLIGRAKQKKLAAAAEEAEV